MWLAGQWDSAYGSSIELRYLSDPVQRKLSCAVLGRVFATSTDEALQAALALRERLATPVRHIHVACETDRSMVARWLTPFTPHPLGLAEIRKQYRCGIPNRPDAGVQYYQAPQPFTVSASPWDPLYQAITAHPHPVMLTVGLEPHDPSPGLRHVLQEVATHYGRLAIPGQAPAGLWSSGASLAPDAFAVDAARIYTDASRRYTDRAFRIRIALASPAPLPDSLSELVGTTVSPPETPAGGTILTAAFTGPAHLTVRPQAHEYQSLWHNLTTLGQTPWGGDWAWRLPAPPSPSMRLIADLADAREAAAAFRLPQAVQGHLAGFPVRHPGLATATDYRPDSPHLTLGRQVVSGTPSGTLGIALQDLTRHTLIAGTTGSGKTNTTLDICEQLWRDHRIPFLVIEPVNSDLNDYRWLATRPGFEDLIVLTVGDESTAPLRLNPFQAPAGTRTSTHIAGLMACFDAAFGLWDPLPNIYNRALRATYARQGIVPTDVVDPISQGTWPTLQDFIAEMRRQCEQLDYSGEVRDNIIAASRLRAEALAEGACSTTLDCARSYPIEELLRRPVVIELAGVGDNEKEQSLITALLLQSMTEHYKANRSDGALAHVTVIEEAHRLLGQPPPQGGESREGNAQARAAQSFANALAENRKYGEGIVIVEQVPGKLIEDAYKNTNLKIMHRLPSEADRHLMGGTMRFAPDQERYAASLAPFHAFAYHDRIDRPALVRVPNVRAEAARAAGVDRAPLAMASELAARFRSFTETAPSVDAALAPFPDCEGCRHRCDFRSRATMAVWPEHATELKKRVATYPKAKADQSAWWQSTAMWVAGIADTVPLPDPTAASDAVADYRACVFLHIARTAWQRKTLPWVRLYRSHTTPGGADQ
ncbi:ATP-binding protein [Streptomyces asiaticus]